MADRQDAVGLHCPAPAVFAGAFVLGLLLNRFAPPAPLPSAARLIGWALVLAGIGAAGLPALITMRRAGTSPNPARPATAFVAAGPYRFTRHPMYLGMAVAYAGAALAANVVWALVLLPAAMAIIQRGAMMREEEYMARKFGEPYRAYMSRVRRWI
ncbi:MAG TPA: isoprenylcysteine carboxylmethyltransferase family protein [bacterium]|nr:isoprenylcysteine carboxylmethyltransferase family protein [bacterium]